MWQPARVFVLLLSLVFVADLTQMESAIDLFCGGLGGVATIALGQPMDTVKVKGTVNSIESIAAVLIGIFMLTMTR